MFSWTPLNRCSYLETQHLLYSILPLISIFNKKVDAYIQYKLYININYVCINPFLKPYILRKEVQMVFTVLLGISTERENLCCRFLHRAHSDPCVVVIVLTPSFLLAEAPYFTAEPRRKLMGQVEKSMDIPCQARGQYRKSNFYRSFSTVVHLTCSCKDPELSGTSIQEPHAKHPVICSELSPVQPISNSMYWWRTGKLLRVIYKIVYGSENVIWSWPLEKWWPFGGVAKSWLAVRDE